MTAQSSIKPTILTYSGEYFDFTKPENSAFSIVDIAHALANLCRFSGHCPFYSVAEHSVHCSHLVPKEHARAALLHDAAEAFLGDVSRPLKSLLPEYKLIEERVERALAERYQLEYPWNSSIKFFDSVMLKHEQHSMLGNQDAWHGLAEIELTDTLPVIANWQPALAKTQFLNRYLDLGGAM